MKILKSILTFFFNFYINISLSSLCEAWRFIRPNEVTAYMFYLKPRTDITFEQFHSTTTLGKT